MKPSPPDWRLYITCRIIPSWDWRECFTQFTVLHSCFRSVLGTKYEDLPGLGKLEPSTNSGIFRKEELLELARKLKAPHLESLEAWLEMEMAAETIRRSGS